MDGDTSGPRGFKGPIGQQLSVDLKILKIADYPPLDAQPITFLDTTTKELSTDQKYLLIASNAVIFGKNKLDQDTLRFLQRSSPGTIYHARWLTTANRSPPPISKNMTDAELSIRVAKKTLAIPDFPCHSQDVERLIKEVTQASAIASDKKSRNGSVASFLNFLAQQT